MKKISTIIFILFAAKAIAQNVGVGETAPTEMKLQVRRADSAVLLLQNSTTSGTDNKTGLFYKTGNYYSGGIATIGSGATFRMGLFTYGGSNPSSLKERITILDGGNVGIGTTNPGYVLDVNGRARFMYNGNTSGFWYNKADNTEAAFVGMVNDSTMGFFGNGAVGNWRMSFDVKNAKMGIGITNPSAPLSFASTVGNKISLWGDASGGHYGLGIQGSLMQLYSSASNADIALGYGSSTAFTENMRIKGNGNVGIGTNNPGAKLEVAGSLKITDGTQGAGKVLTSNASGNASWANAAYGNTERFQFELSTSYSIYNFSTIYNLGTATTTYTNGQDLFKINIIKSGLYHFDINAIQNNLSDISITSTTPETVRINFYTVSVGTWSEAYVPFYKEGGFYPAGCSSTYDKSLDIYITAPSSLVISYPRKTGNYYSSLKVSGHLIAD